MEKGRLARTGRSHDRREPTLFELDVDAVQSLYGSTIVTQDLHAPHHGYRRSVSVGPRRDGV